MNTLLEESHIQEICGGKIGPITIVGKSTYKEKKINFTELYKQRGCKINGKNFRKFRI